MACRFPDEVGANLSVGRYPLAITRVNCMLRLTFLGLFKRQTDVSSKMGGVLEDYPRDAWDAHPGFQDKKRQWLGAHQMLRHMAEQIRLDAEAAQVDLQNAVIEAFLKRHLSDEEELAVPIILHHWLRG